MHPSTWRERLWPIKRDAWPRILPLLLLKFTTSFAYVLLACTKEAVIIPSVTSGAEVASVIKGFFVLPISVLLVAQYIRASNYYSKATLFYGIILIFLAITGLYGFVLYPYRDTLSPHASADRLVAWVPHWRLWIEVYRNWMHTCFYITAELWGQFVIFLLYWGCANDVCDMEEAKTAYPLFIGTGALSMIANGPLTSYCARRYAGDYQAFLQFIVVCVFVCGLLTLLAYGWMQRYVLPKYRKANTGASQPPKLKLSLRESLQHIASSPYLIAVFCMVLSCAFAQNILNVGVRAQQGQLFPVREAYHQFTAQVNMWAGVITLVQVFFISGQLLRWLGWHFSAQLTPVVTGCGGVIFYLMSYYQEALQPWAQSLGMTPLALVVYVGALQSLLSRAMKYAAFDTTLQMTYIPLDPESKVKGKAAIDVVGSRLGKGGSSALQLLLLRLGGTLSILATIPWVLLTLVLMSVVWSYAAYYLSKKIPNA